jgi:hypothetical protein
MGGGAVVSLSGVELQAAGALSRVVLRAAARSGVGLLLQWRIVSRVTGRQRCSAASSTEPECSMSPHRADHRFTRSTPSYLVRGISCPLYATPSPIGYAAVTKGDPRRTATPRFTLPGDTSSALAASLCAHDRQRAAHMQQLWLEDGERDCRRERGRHAGLALRRLYGHRGIHRQGGRSLGRAASAGRASLAGSLSPAEINGARRAPPARHS